MKRVWDDKYWLTVSNVLTGCRVIAGPIVVMLMYYGWWNRAFYLFLTAAATDLLDGHLARAFDQQTHLGAFLDPIADKLLVLSTVTGVVFFHTPFLRLPYWFWLALFLREVVMVIGAAYLVLTKRDVSLSPSIWGKLTTLTQILFLLWLYVCYRCDWHPVNLFFLLMLSVVMITLSSCVHYILRAQRELSGQNGAKI